MEEDKTDYSRMGLSHRHLSGSLHNITQEELEMSTPDSKAEELPTVFLSEHTQC